MSATILGVGVGWVLVKVCRIEKRQSHPHLSTSLSHLAISGGTRIFCQGGLRPPQPTPGPALLAISLMKVVAHI